MRDAPVSVPKRLLLSYIFDWILIMCVPPSAGIPSLTFFSGIALIGYGFSKVTPNHYPFSLTDPSISLPYTAHETVSTAVLVVVSLIAPAVIIVAVAFVFIPGSAASEALGEAPSRSVLWRYKIWEWNAGWLGLGLSMAGVFMATQGLKDLYGKPRPDLLARCNPDLSQIAAHTVGGLGSKLTDAATLVSWEICQNKSDDLKVDGFSSFPSGHSSSMAFLYIWEGIYRG